MVPQLSNMDHIEEEQDDTWVLVGEGTYFGEGGRLGQCSISMIQKSAAIVNDEALPDLACKPRHTQCCPPPIDGVLHSIRASAANPTPGPKVEFAESTATGLTISAPEDVSSDPQPSIPTEDDSQVPPLTWANLGPNNTAKLTRDIQAWINGELGWLRVDVGGDQASVVPFERATTGHSSGGSLDFIFVPAQPANFGRDAMKIGTMFEHLPFTQPYSLDVELDEA